MLAWEKHYNVRQGGTAATTLIFSSVEALHVPSDPSPSEPAKSTYISEMTIQTNAAPESLAVSQPDARPTTPQHTYRSLMNAKAERFAYLRQVSEGRPYPSSSSSTGNSKLSDPGPPKSLMELNLSRSASAGQHQRSHSDSDSPSSASASILPPKPPVPPKVAPPPRPKRPEEVECDQLSKDLINHLLPSRISSSFILMHMVWLQHCNNHSQNTRRCTFFRWLSNPVASLSPAFLPGFSRIPR